MTLSISLLLLLEKLLAKRWCCWLLEKCIWVNSMFQVWHQIRQRPRHFSKIYEKILIFLHITRHKINIWVLHADEMMASGFKSSSSLLFPSWWWCLYVKKQFINETNEFYVRLSTLFMDAFYALMKLAFALCDMISFCVSSVSTIMDFHACKKISHKPSFFHVLNIKPFEMLAIRDRVGKNLKYEIF